MEKTGGWMSKIMNEIKELEVIEGKDRCILGCFGRKGQEVASPPQTLLLAPGVCFNNLLPLRKCNYRKKNATLEGPVLKKCLE